MLRQRARAFKNFFHLKRKKTSSSNRIYDVPDSNTVYLRMETFVSPDHEIINENLLKSSSSSSSVSSIDSSDDENCDVFSWNKKTGDWESYTFEEHENRTGSKKTSKNTTNMSKKVKKMLQKIDKTTKPQPVEQSNSNFLNIESEDDESDDSETPLIGV